ncbi:Low-density lipoprotein receptor-related protein 8 [Folsomia candida]|uniref:Low-density lipoprotein receptor-related protein 8 n=1 Tax=Folsomia candida TaxID=158441 RepID=A0A226EL59_FOLCA|nr:Low-density lipoprotein receptor-related protein 8 [Folsomia candida]
MVQMRNRNTATSMDAGLTSTHAPTGTVFLYYFNATVVNNDCADGSDERDCPCPDPVDDWTRCDDGTCVLKEYWCDEHGIHDCPDKSDETNCSRTTTAEPSTTSPSPISPSTTLGDDLYI